MNLKRYYFLGVIIPALVSALTLIIVSFVLFEDNNNDAVSTNRLIFALVFGAFAMSFLGCFFSATMFLNKFRFISKNAILSFIAWFLVPSLYFTKLFTNFDDASHETGGMMEFALILTIPTSFGLILSFIFFRRQLSNKLEDTNSLN